MSDYGERLRKAKREWDDAHDPETISWAEVARQCSTILGRRVHAETVLLWKSAKQEPKLAEFEALGIVLEVAPQELAFGPRKRAEARQEPAAMVARDRLAVPTAKDKKRGA